MSKKSDATIEYVARLISHDIRIFSFTRYHRNNIFVEISQCRDRLKSPLKVRSLPTVQQEVPFF